MCQQAAQQQRQRQQAVPASQRQQSSEDLQQRVAPAALASREALGVGCLLLVSLLWGTYTPALRLVYGMPGPPNAAVVTGVRGALQVLLLLSANLAVAVHHAASAGQRQGAGYASVPSGRGVEGDEGEQEMTAAAAPEASRSLEGRGWLGRRAAGLPPVVMGGIEVGGYNAVGTAVQAWALTVRASMRTAAC